MGRSRRRQDADLDALYEQVPDVGCKGKCHNTCGAIDMSPREHARIRDVAGVDIPEPSGENILAHVKGTWSCPALTADKRCSVYEWRPMICRLSGAVEGLPCPHDCAPSTGRLLTDAEAVTLLVKASAAGGGSPALAAADVHQHATKHHRAVRAILQHNPTATDKKEALG